MAAPQQGRRGEHRAPPAAEAAADLVARARSRVAKEGFAFETFQVGVSVNDSMLRRTGRLDSYKDEVKRLATAALLEQWPGRRAVARFPDVVFVFEVAQRFVHARVASIHVYGRYRKLSRDLPQTRWYCTACHGKGCPECAGRGLEHASSVEALVGGPLRERFQAKDAILHGMGREDRDVRALGAGRPFVVELVRPRERSTDLVAAAREIDARASGLVEIVGALVAVGSSVVTKVKSLEPTKKYRARVELASAPGAARVASLADELHARPLAQRTPERVARRRADLVRTRRVLAASARLDGERALELELHVEAGTYVKELVSGDDGRTTPSVAELLGVAARVVELDVLEVCATDEEILGSRAAADSAHAKPKPGASGPT